MDGTQGSIDARYTKHRGGGCSRSAPPLDPEIFNNVYNAIAREAPCNGSFNDLQSARSSKPMLFRSNSLFAGSCCFLSPRKTSEILNPDVSVVKSAFSVPFFPSLSLSLHFSPYFRRYRREKERSKLSSETGNDYSSRYTRRYFNRILSRSSS